MNKEILFILISWFAVGFFTLIASIVYDMRGKAYDESYFDDNVGSIFMIVFLGYVSIILFFLCYLSDNGAKERITKLVYKIANIGIKQKEQENDGE